ncbi:MAG: 50S ribosomal protein L25 [Caldilineaceae bacterium]|nr:50S ribosomal protein L25 [Caldilineaceae bacterium]
MTTLKLEAQPRSLVGSKVKQLRRQGKVPVVIYGKHQTPENIQVDAFTFDRLLSGGASSQLLEVTIEGVGIRNVLIREVQRHPVRHEPLHADFYAVSMTEKQRVHVPVVAVGRTGGLAADLVMVQSLDHVEIEALPADIPAHVEVDISRLDSAEAHPITVAEFPEMPGVVYMTPAEETAFSIVVTRAAAEEEEVEEVVDAEPELIGRERDDEDETDE